jgi:hypothetical protein
MEKKMGYKLRPGSVLRMKKFLDEMLTECRTLQYKTARPESLRFRLLQAIKSAEALSPQHSQFLKYRGLGTLYNFRVQGDRVFAVWHEDRTGSVRLVESTEVIVDMPIRSAEAVLGVIQNAEDADELIFVNASLSLRDQKLLYKWTQSDTVRWSYIDHYNGTITMTLRTVEPEILWRPENENGSS